MLRYFIVALYQCCTCLYCTIDDALFEYSLYYLLLRHLMFYYINIVMFYVALLILGYFNFALIDAALFTVELLNVVLF